ncbi:hypothetical protein GA0070564_10996 [Micromonospora mirobrigensis]|uniref:Golvesin/Xly CBD-like domain-containing protein n=2 Tax=Micromonospora mirobrigensis TaxID=262898 RepID=A0A1C5ADV1_9ACTN|nr:hypothetical protein GA0070564_10996 [Micromonospora mirobrigensis]
MTALNVSRRRLALLTTGAVTVSLLQGPMAQARPEPQPTQQPRVGTVAAADRDRVLGRSWRGSTDRAWTTAGDADGFHVLVADAADGYAWRTAATLREAGFDTDRWIGNACVTSSGRRAVVVYAPRTFTNKAELSARGGFTAVVDLSTGAVTKLPVTTSLAYFNPGCGAGESVALTQEGDEEQPGTRLLRLDAERAEVGRKVQLKGQFTSAVPSGDGFVGALGDRLASVDAKGGVRNLAASRGVPFAIRPDRDGGVNFLESAGGTMRARRLTKSKVTTLAEGKMGAFDLERGAAGRVFLTGRPAAVKRLPAPVTRLAVSASAEVSTTGGLAFQRKMTAQETLPGAATPADAKAPVQLDAQVPATGDTVAFQVTPTATTPAAATPALGVSRPATAAGPQSRTATAEATTGDLFEPYTPQDPDPWCAVPRNDMATQAYHPRPRQIEWAVDYAIFGALAQTRPANFRGFGLPAYSPQGMFPPRTLAGGKHVAAQIMLGILAQESNLWQASQTQSGEYGNPLIGNYYGRHYYDADTSDDWRIHWDEADCGYGVGQVTDGMRKAGKEKPGETARPADHQRAIALDYAANIAAALQILQDKWNQTYNANLRINNADPTRIENWYFAAWAYNSGFYPDKGDGSPWGVGWGNNPINPRYDPARHPFLDVADPYNVNDNVPVFSDAAHPQDWPYQEKVIGWAAQSIDTGDDGVGFRTAWWLGDPLQARLRRTAQTPPFLKFCNFTNTCDPMQSVQPNAPGMETEKPGPCLHKNSAGQYDLKCWFHLPVIWKDDCIDSCGFEGIRYDVPMNYSEPTDGTHNPPKCTASQLPSNAIVVDFIRAGASTPRCPGVTPRNDGTAQLEFKAGWPGEYTSKIDFHQLDNGMGGHHWFTRARASYKNQVIATWSPPVAYAGWTGIYAYIPQTGARAPDVVYDIKTGDGRIRHVTVDQEFHRNSWVFLGNYQLRSGSSVTLDSFKPAPSEKTIGFDAIGFVPGGGS